VDPGTEDHDPRQAVFIRSAGTAPLGVDSDSPGHDWKSDLRLIEKVAPYKDQAEPERLALNQVEAPVVTS
jgi:hypothetical protein